MRTGEGKTLVATLPAYLNSLSGEGVHVVTVNDYLARRDAHWMGEVYSMLGVTVGALQNQKALFYEPEYSEGEKGFEHMRPASRQEAYGGRHHLRDEQRVRVRLSPRQHGHNR